MSHRAVTALLSLLVGVGLTNGAQIFAAEPSRRVVRLSTGRVETVPLETYVAAVLPGEIGNAPAAALEAQAVAARSYAMARTDRHAEAGADLCDGTHCQVYRGAQASTAASRRAAESTRGLVLVQAGRVIAAPFHSVCGGRTARPSDVWDDEETPDLAPVEDDACAGSPGAEWELRFGRERVGALGKALGLGGARFLEVYGRDGSGRAAMVRLVAPGGRNLVVRGFDFRRVANDLWGWTTVRSTDFRVTGEDRDGYVLSGRGTGHGAGLCQRGAIRRAARGESREEILGRYYPGTGIRALETLAPGATRESVARGGK